MIWWGMAKEESTSEDMERDDEISLDIELSNGVDEELKRKG